MEPQAKVHVPESAKKDKAHKHEWHWLEEPDYVNTFEHKVHCGDISEHGECEAVLTWDEVKRRLNALEGMKTWQDGIYTGTQIRDFARLISDPASPTSS